MGLRDKLKAEAEKYLGQSFHSNPHSHSHASPHVPHVDLNQQPLTGHKIPFEPLPCPQHKDHPCEDPGKVEIASVTELGDVQSLTTYVVRDLGFAGQIGQHVLYSYGDTMYTDSNYNADTFMGMTSDSVAIATHDPLRVIDVNLNEHKYPDQFVPVNKDWGEDMSTHAVGITNVIETDAQAGEGIVYTLLNHRPGGANNIRGAGIAKVKLSSDPVPVPKAERLAPTIWDGDTEPFWGDCGAIRNSEYIYAYGHKKDNPWVYLTRVRIPDVMKVECYEYWHGKDKGWSSERLRGDGLGHDQSVFWQVNQGQVIWSPYHNRYLFLYCDNFWSSSVQLRTSLQPEGPWSEIQTVAKIKPVTEGNTIYAATPYPHFDPSGKTLIVGYTNTPNKSQIMRIDFA